MRDNELVLHREIEHEKRKWFYAWHLSVPKLLQQDVLEVLDQPVVLKPIATGSFRHEQFHKGLRVDAADVLCQIHAKLICVESTALHLLLLLNLLVTGKTTMRWINLLYNTTTFVH